MRRKTYL